MTLGAWEWAHIAVGGCASVIFLFETLTGTGAEGGTSGADSPDLAPGDDFSFSNYLSVRNFVAFFIGYGWVTLACLASGYGRQLSSLIGAAAGCSFAVVSILLIRMFIGLQEDGTMKLETLAGGTASVYIAIGASASSPGKVMIDTRKGRLELPARTNDPDELRPGCVVRVLSADGGILWVTRGIAPR